MSDLRQLLGSCCLDVLFGELGAHAEGKGPAIQPALSVLGVGQFHESQRRLQEPEQPRSDLGGKAYGFVLRLVDKSMAGARDERDIRRKARLLEQDQKVGRLLRIDDVVFLAMDQHEAGAVLVDCRVGGRRGSATSAHQFTLE